MFPQVINQPGFVMAPPGVQLQSTGSYVGGNVQTAKPITAQLIQKYIDTARKQQHLQPGQPGPPLIYWKANKAGSQMQTLNLSAAITYVAQRYSNLPENNPFVYFPDYLVCGELNQIVTVFRAAGINQLPVGKLYEMSSGAFGNQPGTTINVDPESVLANSINVRNPRQAEFLKAYFDNPANKLSNPNKLSLEENIEIAMLIAKHYNINIVIPELPKEGAAPEQPKHAVSTIETKLRDLLDKFNTVMDQVLTGQTLEKGYNVSKFNATELTGVTKLTMPKSNRGQNIVPTFVLNNMTYRSPIGVNPANVDNAILYLSIIGPQSRHPNAAQALINSFTYIKNQRAPGGIQHGVTGTGPIVGQGVVGFQPAEAGMTGITAPFQPSQIPGFSQTQMPQFPGLGQPQQMPQIPGLGQTPGMPQIPGLGQPQQTPGQPLQIPQIQPIAIPGANVGMTVPSSSLPPGFTRV